MRREKSGERGILVLVWLGMKALVLTPPSYCAEVAQVSPK